MTPDQLKSNRASKCKDPWEMEDLRTGGDGGAGEDKGQRQGCRGQRGEGVWSLVCVGVRLVLSLLAPVMPSTH